MAKNYDSEYSIQKDILAKVGGDTTKCYDSPYEIQLAILEAIQGGGGGGAVIDDNNVSTGTAWSSAKIVSELADAGFDVQVVQELPTTGDPHTLYFVPSDDPQSANTYDEYLYVNNNWELVGSTAVDMSDYYTADEVDTILDDYATKVDISTFAQIDDNNVSTGTVFSSAKCDGEYYHDISTNIEQQINLYELHNIAANLTDSSTFRVNFRDDNLYIDVELYPLSAAKTETFEQITAENISVILHYYNTVNEYTVNGEWFRLYITYNTNDSRSSGLIYPYFVYSDIVPGIIYEGILTGSFNDSPQNLLYINIYGWNSRNTPANSDIWGWLTLRNLYSSNNLMDQWAKVNTYGSHIYPVSNNNNYINFLFKNTPYIQNGGYIRWDNLFIEQIGTDAFNINSYNVYANGLVKGKTEIGEAWNYNINGITVSFFKPTRTNGYNAGNLFIPTTSGTAGQYLISSGSSAPTWQDLEVASDYVISDADASAGTYSTDVSAFYNKTIEANVMQGVQIKITDEHVVDNVSVYSDSYYLPSSSRIYEGNVELWLMFTEDGQSWENRHYLITDNTISRDISTGYFGCDPQVLADVSTALDVILNGSTNA